MHRHKDRNGAFYLLTIWKVDTSEIWDIYGTDRVSKFTQPVWLTAEIWAKTDNWGYYKKYNNFDADEPVVTQVSP